VGKEISPLIFSGTAVFGDASAAVFTVFTVFTAATSFICTGVVDAAGAVAGLVFCTSALADFASA
jgi:hypothetical protein